MTSPHTDPMVLRGVVLQGSGLHVGKPALAREQPAAQAAPPSAEHEQRALAAERAGYVEGLRRGRVDAQAELARTAQAASDERQAQQQQLGQLLQALPAAAAQRLAELELDCIALAYAATCVLVGEHAHHRATLEHLLRAGLTQLHGSVLERVRLNAADLAALGPHTLLDRFAGVAWVADAGVPAGGCLLDSAAGTLDARIDTQLTHLRALWAHTLAAREV